MVGRRPMGPGSWPYGAETPALAPSRPGFNSRPPAPPSGRRELAEAPVRLIYGRRPPLRCPLWTALAPRHESPGESNGRRIRELRGHLQKRGIASGGIGGRTGPGPRRCWAPRARAPAYRCYDSGGRPLQGCGDDAHGFLLSEPDGPIGRSRPEVVGRRPGGGGTALGPPSPKTRPRTIRKPFVLFRALMRALKLCGLIRWGDANG
jgi:hypothetical protein